jgi:RecA-family ATPase
MTTDKVDLDAINEALKREGIKPISAGKNASADPPHAEEHTADQWRAEITVFEKSNGPLTKRIALHDGKIVNDSSSCRMANGSAQRVTIDSMQALADLTNGFTSRQAYALGRLKDGLPDRVQVVRADKLNGAGDPSVIARTQDYLIFKDGPGVVLLDVDFKALSVDAKRHMDECGGLWGALCEVLPALETVALVERASTSAGLQNKETGECFSGSGGRHIVTPVLDAADIPRFLADFHARCWLKGFGWGMVSAAGSFLERSIIDKSVGSPERLIFEGAPMVVSPLEQIGRNAVAQDGHVLDTRLCAPLTDDEEAELQSLIAAENNRLLPERTAARAQWSVKHIQRLFARGVSEPEARAQVDRWIDNKELSGPFALPFDDQKLAGTTVEQVLASPDQYIGKTLSDPFEGPSYGTGKAIIFQRGDGSIGIHSFAHGGIVYQLRAEPKPLPPLVFVDMSTWDDEPLPEQDWTVRDIIPARQVTLFSGHGAAGKSTVGLYLDAAHVTAGPWLNFMPEPGSAFFIDAEDEERVIHRRLGAITQHCGIKFKDLIDRGLRILSLAGEDAVMAAANRNGVVEPTKLYHRILEEASDIKPRQIVIASAANVFAGSEIDRAQVTQFVGLLTKIAIRTDGSVVLISHPSLTGIANASGISGSTQWHNAVRARMYLQGVKPGNDEQPDNDLRVMEFMKNQYGPISNTITLRWKNGMFLPDTSGSSVNKLQRDQNADTVFLNLMHLYAAQKTPVTPNKFARNYAPTAFAKEAEATNNGMKKRDLENAMQRLIDKGTIMIKTWGPPSRRHD